MAKVLFIEIVTLRAGAIKATADGRVKQRSSDLRLLIKLHGLISSMDHAPILNWQYPFLGDIHDDKIQNFEP